MALSKIKYKNFTFPNNTETTTFKCDKAFVKHKYPGLTGEELEDMGADAIIISGEGYFFGDNAYKNFKALYTEFNKKGVGEVSHPIFTQVTKGLMTSLEGHVEPGGKAIKIMFDIVADTVPDTKEVIAKKSSNSSSKSSNKKKTSSKKKTYKVGDIVNFKGGKYYTSSYKGAKSKNGKAGKAKITLGPNCKGNGGVHPYHLVRTSGSKSNVYGWVDTGSFS